jgi:GR25 family glycosyltransferase involved in LPS biosynthesis
MKNIKYFYIFNLFLIVVVCSYLLNYIIENFEVVQDIDFYIISLKNEDRMKNIDTQIEKIKNSEFEAKNIEIIEAIPGKDLELNKLIEEGVLSPDAYLNQDPDLEKRKEIHKREVGCYLSHMKTYKAIAEKNKDGFSVIFEDDFELLDDFLKTLDETMIKIKEMDFDILFLGMIGHKGDNIIDNVFHIHDSESWCAHGYLVNNKSANKILDKMKYIDTVLDKELFDKGRAKELIIYRLDPLIVDTVDLYTGIRY